MATTPKRFLTEVVTNVTEARQCVGKSNTLLFVKNNKTLYHWDPDSYFTDNGTTCIATVFGNDAGRFHGIAGEWNFYTSTPPVPTWTGVSGTATLTPSADMLYRIDTIFAACNITFNAGSAFDGMKVIFKKVGGTNPATITCTGGETIDGINPYILSANMESLTLIYDEAVGIWWIV